MMEFAGQQVSSTETLFRKNKNLEDFSWELCKAEKVQKTFKVLKQNTQKIVLSFKIEKLKLRDLFADP